MIIFNAFAFEVLYCLPYEGKKNILPLLVEAEKIKSEFIISLSKPIKCISINFSSCVTPIKIQFLRLLN